MSNDMFYDLEEYLNPYQTSKMEFFSKIVNYL